MRIVFIQKLIDKIRGKNNPPLLSVLFNGNNIIVLGDSHCNFFSGNEYISFVSIDSALGINNCQDKLPFFTTCHLGPVLAYNLNKYDTTTQGREKIEYLINNSFIPKMAKIICCFGEIDIRVHVLRQAEKQNTTYKIIVDKIIDNYLDLLLYLKKTNQVYVWGPICTQKDNSDINPEFPYYGTETDRNIATEYFNNKLEEICNKNGIVFLSIFKSLIDENYKSKSYYLADGCHLSRKAWEFALYEISSKNVFKDIFKKA